jgi:PBSX family phage terminase large subunit
MFTGVFYKRYILGDWVMAEGLIYENFDVDTMTFKDPPPMQRYWYGVDYGTSNATTFMLIGQGTDHKFYVLDEYYHSNLKSGTQKSPQQYSNELKEFIAKHNLKYEYIYIDPSAEGFIITCYQNGIQKISQAMNDVKLGIGIIQSLITEKKFFVAKHCKETLKELSSYSWDIKAQQLGQDKPMKTNDHCMDPIRYVANATRGHWYQTTKNPLFDNKGYHRL